MKNLLEKFDDLKETRSDEVLEEKLNKHPYDTLLNLVEYGRLLNESDNIKNELVYAILDINPAKFVKQDGTKLLGDYINKIVKVEGINVRTIDAFNNLFHRNIQKRFSDETLRTIHLQTYLRGMGKELVEKVFGKGTYSFFDFAYKTHLKTKEMRALKNTYFAHPVRIAHQLKSYNLPKEYILVALLHDVIESMQKQRKKDKGTLSDKMKKDKGVTNQEKIKLYDDMAEINYKLKNPPEYKQIERKSYHGQNVGKRIIEPLKAVSNDSKIDYEDYIIKLYFKSENCKHGDNEGICDIAPIVKLQDAIDNTESLYGIGGKAQLERLGRNVILSNHTYSFLQRNQISKKDNFLMWNRIEKLIYLSATKTEEYESIYLLKSKTVKDKILIKNHYDSNLIYASNRFSEISLGVKSIAEKVLPREILRNLYGGR